MKVYVVECDVYDQADVAGVYSSLEVAMSAHPISDSGSVLRAGGWKSEGDGRWWNGMDWHHSTRITEWVVDEFAHTDA